MPSAPCAPRGSSRVAASCERPRPASTPPATSSRSPPAGALVEHWLTQPQLGKAERLILTALADAWPATMTKDDLAAAAGYAAGGGGFNNALGKLRTLELISGRGELQLSNDLFA